MAGEDLVAVVDCGVGRRDVGDGVVGASQDVDKGGGISPKDDDELVAIVEEVGRVDYIGNGDGPLLSEGGEVVDGNRVVAVGFEDGQGGVTAESDLLGGVEGGGFVWGYGKERGQAVAVENLEGAIVIPDEEEVEVGGEGHVDVGVAGYVGGHDVVVQELGE